MSKNRRVFGPKPSYKLHYALIALFVILAVIVASLASKTSATSEAKDYSPMEFIESVTPTPEAIEVEMVPRVREVIIEEVVDDTFVNDGYELPRSECYGKLSDAKPISKKWDYYDCAIPYNLTTMDVGGLLCSNGASDKYGSSASHAISSSDGSTYLADWPVSPRYCGSIGYRGSDLCHPNYFYSHGGTTCDGAYGFWIDGEFYYYSAIQYYAYPREYVFDYSDGKDRSGHKKSTDPMSLDYYTWNSVGGEIFDAILTDGTVIHCVASDANGMGHTNHGLGDTRYSSHDTRDWWPVSPLKLEQYACMFSCYQQSMLEIGGTGNYSSNFESKYNLGGKKGNRVAYIRMYDKVLDDIV